jgi:hypothetical protein
MGRKTSLSRRALRAEEEWARSLIEQALGTSVVQHDDGSSDGMHDLDIVQDGRPLEAVEVTAVADGASIALWKLLNDHDERWIEPDLAGGWMVRLLPVARGKRIRKELPVLLQALEAIGIEDLRTGFGSRHTLSRCAADLGIVGAHQSGTDFPGSIYVTVEPPADRTGGFVADTGDALAEWLGPFLDHDDRTDVRSKLMRSGASARHAFVFFPPFSDAPFAVTDLLMRQDLALPTIAPRLPAEVTHVWAAGGWSSGRGMRWSPTVGWSYFEK